jgi:hypothetical protein
MSKNKPMTNYDEYRLNDDKHWEWHTTFIGRLMQHNYRVYHILDGVFKIAPNLGAIVEIGTGCGALTTYLGLWGLHLNIPVLTVDNVRSTDTDAFLQRLGVTVLDGDVFSTEVYRKIKEFVGQRPVFLLCDGGAKQREFDTWARLLVSGSFIAAHDLGHEFSVENISEWTRTLVTPVMEERWNEMNAQIAIFKVN